MLGTLVSVLILVQIDSAVYLGQIFWPHLVLHCYIFLRVLPCGRWPCTWGKYGESCSSNLHSTTKLTKGIRFWKPIQDQISSSEKKIHEVMETKSRWWTHRNIFFFFLFSIGSFSLSSAHSGAAERAILLRVLFIWMFCWFLWNKFTYTNIITIYKMGVYSKCYFVHVYICTSETN